MSMSAVKAVLADASMWSKEVCDQHVTVGFVLQSLISGNAEFKKLVESARVSNVHARDISDGKGFASIVYKGSVEFEDDTHEPYSFIMKIPVTQFFKEFLFSDKDGKDTGDPVEAIMSGHNGECAFYEAFKDAGHFPLAKVWYTRKMTRTNEIPGLIIMEDLSSRGACPGIVASASVQQIKNIARYLAALHAHSLCSEASRLPDGNFYHVEQWEADIFWRFIDDLLQYDLTLSPLVEKFKPAATPEFARWALLERPKQLDLPAMLCHGDLWVNNMLFKQASDGTATNEVLAFLDWQNVFYGNPMFDLARYLAFCADAEVRREVEQFLFDFYLSELTLRMAEKNRKAYFTAGQLREAYLLAQIQQTTEAIPMVPFADKLAPCNSEPIREAVKAKLAVRVRLLMEDAIRAMDEVAKDFFAKRA